MDLDSCSTFKRLHTLLSLINEQAVNTKILPARFLFKYSMHAVPNKREIFSFFMLLNYT